MRKQKFDIAGMSCAACAVTIEKKVNALNGVAKAEVSLLTNSMTVEFNPSLSNEKIIIQSVEKAGYQAAIQNNPTVHQTMNPNNVMDDEVFTMKKRLIVSFAFLIPLLYLSMGHMLHFPLPSWLHGQENAIPFSFTQFLLTLPIVYINRKFFTNGFKALMHRSPNMDSLIAIGSSAALIYSVYAIYKIGWGLGHNDPVMINMFAMNLYFESAATILSLVTTGKYLETRSKKKTSDAITKLIDLVPKTASVIRDGIEMIIPADDVRVGDMVIIRPGQKIPVDGTVIEGYSSIDQSAITGESIPIVKKPGDKVITGTMNQSGSISFRADRIGKDTTLSQIIELVENANTTKAPIAKIADKISAVFVPIVIFIAVVSALSWLLLGKSFEFALTTAISVLVISCPCALGLATPVAIMVGTGKGASNGILIKSGEALEITHKIQTVVLDKTGTITEGKPKVTDIFPSGNYTDLELLTIAASLEKLSEHPLADAILQKADELSILIKKATDFQAIPGQGVSAWIDGIQYFAGNQRFMETQSISLSTHSELDKILSDKGKSLLFFAEGKNLIGSIAVADTIKSGSKEAIDQFKKMGIHVVMLTGDNRYTAEAIRKQLAIDEVVAEVLPQGKDEVIRKLQDSGKKVAMIGDGINDAPALARADVGIAIGAGTDIAIESADIVLIKNSLLDAVTAIHLSRSVIKNIKENLFWAFFYNIIGIPLAAGLFYPLTGWTLNPMFAAAAMSLSSLTVVSNALRLRFFRPQTENHFKSDFSNDSVKKEEKRMIRKTIQIDGMSCAHCKARVENALQKVDGVSSVVVDLETKSADLELSKAVDNKILTDAITDAGYEPCNITEG
ncbi:heavy metal translocating P-type ATPase [Flexilinea flocculi]|uniref:Copper-exporting P-type ATPase n=1 Tax=Flexilinea flocculi TaxID=1678840 RepID=A0A0K8P9H4_9CHLR|nr:heavy metal translocating P-type ATPase [Flexilinea flocculi]GAP39281.1 copper-(or silver)-translocating P-type ATPase [Flexilinea flocculi]